MKSSIAPGSEIERRLLGDPQLRAGLDWGLPRAGHPEGSVGELIGDDGLRVVLQWRWHGSRRELIERDEEVVREALTAHPFFEQIRPVEEQIFHDIHCG